MKASHYFNFLGIILEIKSDIIDTDNENEPRKFQF